MDEQLPLFSQPPADVPPVSAPQLTAASPLKAAIVAWQGYLEQQRLSPHTVKAFAGDLNLFARHVGAGCSLGQLTTRDLENWLQWLNTVKRCSPKTYARRVTSLKSFFRWLKQSGALSVDLAAPVVQHTVISPLPQILTAEEVEAALTAAEAMRHGEKADARPYVLLTLLLYTGIKKGECLALVPNHVDLSDPAEPVLWVRYPDPRHRYKERKLRLPSEWITAYREYLAQYNPQDKLFPWSARRLEYLLDDIAKAAGLQKRITFDVCRWTCAVRDARAGMDFDQIRQKLGLSKIQWREISMKLKKLIEPAL